MIDDYVCENCGRTLGVVKSETGHWWCARCDWMQTRKTVNKVYRAHNLLKEKALGMIMVFGKDKK